MKKLFNVLVKGSREGETQCLSTDVHLAARRNIMAANRLKDALQDMLADKTPIIPRRHVEMPHVRRPH